jgi:hypothetical protein
MSLDTAISLTTVDEVLSYLGIDNPERNALWVYYDGANATATIEVQDTKIVLTDSVATNIVFTTYDTLTKVVDKINSVAGGWHAGLIYIGTLSSGDLIITGSLNAKGSGNEQTLKISDLHLIEQLINRASDLMNKYCERNLKSKTYTLEKYDGGGEYLILNNYPVTNIVQVCEGEIDAIKIKYTSSTAFNAYATVTTTGVILTVDGVSEAELTFAGFATMTLMAAKIDEKLGWEASIASSDYGGWPSSLLFEKRNVYALNQYSYLQSPEEPLDEYKEDLEAGMIYLTSGFDKDFKNVYVTYTAGYSTIPASLEEICIELVKFKYEKGKKDSTLQSEKIGSVYSYTLADIKTALPPGLMEELDYFKRRIIV